MHRGKPAEGTGTQAELQLGDIHEHKLGSGPRAGGPLRECVHGNAKLK